MDNPVPMHYVDPLEDLCETVGYAATRVLAVWYAGQKVYVPRTLRPGGREHPLASLIGEQALAQLVQERGGEYLIVPTASEDERVRRLRRVALALIGGQTPGQIAVDLGITRRRVEQMRAELVGLQWLRYAAGPRRRRLEDAMTGIGDPDLPEG